MKQHLELAAIALGVGVLGYVGYQAYQSRQRNLYAAEAAPNLEALYARNAARMAAGTDYENPRDMRLLMNGV